MKLAAFFMSAVLVGQVPTSLNFGSPAVSAPIPSATAVGATGFTNTFYWVVARTPGGYSSPGAAIATNTVGSANFSVSNYVVISWPAISGATGYDVIRSDSPSYPASTSCASCAVALNQAGTSFSDQGGATSAYSGGAQSVATQAIFTLDNVTVATPQINVQILNSRQNVTFALPSTGVGTVTSVGMTVPGALLSVSGSPITTSGTLAVSLVTQSANCVFAGPTSGGAATPTCRALVSSDLPAGTGTVTSVGLSLPSIITVSGSPVTGAGTLTGALATQTANTIWAGPTTGAAAAPTFRALVAADMPAGVIPTGNAVGGASNLTTVNAVPYVSASGVFNQDASNFFWDATNHRLGIGTNAPKSPLHVATGPIVVEGTSNPASTSGLELHTSAGISYVTAATRNSGGSITAYLPTVHEGSYIAYKNSGTEYGRLTGGKWGFGSGNTSPSTTVYIYDATASTGVTTLTVKAGAGQSSTDLQQWQNSAGTVLASVGSSGAFSLPNSINVINDIAETNSGYGFTGGSPTIYKAGSQGLYIDGNGLTTVINGGNVRLGGSGDTSLSRVSAGVVGVGIGAAGSVAGTLQAAGYMANGGTKFTASGCSNSTTVGGATAGTFTSGTTGACTVTITMNGATGLTAPTGWACSASDFTTPANLISQSASTATTATLTGTTVSGDVISFSCIGY